MPGADPNTDPDLSEPDSVLRDLDSGSVFRDRDAVPDAPVDLAAVHSVDLVAQADPIPAAAFLVTSLPVPRSYRYNPGSSPSYKFSSSKARPRTCLFITICSGKGRLCKSGGQIQRKECGNVDKGNSLLEWEEWKYLGLA